MSLPPYIAPRERAQMLFDVLTNGGESEVDRAAFVDIVAGALHLATVVEREICAKIFDGYTGVSFTSTQVRDTIRHREG